MLAARRTCSAPCRASGSSCLPSGVAACGRSFQLFAGMRPRRLSLRGARALDAAGLTINEITAKTLEHYLDSFERLDRMLASAEARRNNALREIDRHRSAVGPAVRQAIDEAEDVEVYRVQPSIWQNEPISKWSFESPARQRRFGDRPVPSVRCRARWRATGYQACPKKAIGRICHFYYHLTYEEVFSCRHATLS